MGIRAEELVLVVKAIMKVPGLEEYLKQKDPIKPFSSDTLTKYCEIIGVGGKEKIVLAEILLYNEKFRAKQFIGWLASYIEHLTPNKMRDSIKSKTDAQELAVAMGIIEDYIVYLESGTWDGPKKAESIGYLAKSRARYIAGISNLDLYKTYKYLDEEEVEPVLDELRKLSKGELISEICALYFHISKVSKGDSDDLCNKER